MKKRFLKPLAEFLESGADFKLVYKSAISSSFISASTQRICILDSSFNPPHLGHLSLAAKSIFFDYNQPDLISKIPVPIEENIRNSEGTVLLLLLSVKNADKIVPQPAAFEDRIEMMSELADYISKTYNTKTAVGLTNHAKFVDKYSAIKNVLLSNIPRKLTFLVGFDTLIRIFNPKYYFPQTLKESLNEFITSTDFFCLTRADEEYLLEDQIKYLDDIKLGKNEDVPSNWADSIFLVDSDDATLNISSSHIRNHFHDADVSNQVLPDTFKYIKDNQLYH